MAISEFIREKEEILGEVCDVLIAEIDEVFTVSDWQYIVEQMPALRKTPMYVVLRFAHK